MIQYKNLNIAGKLIYINVAVFIATQLYVLLMYLFNVHGYNWQNYLALPANINDFILVPWTLLTYFFAHADLATDMFHILFNMLWLWWFGQYFLRYHTGRQLLSVYLLGGLFSGLFYLLVFNIFPVFSVERSLSSVVGASGAIFALIVAVAMHSPNDMLYLNLFVRYVTIKLKWVAVAALLLNILSLPNSYNTGGIICHLGGALWGFIYGYCEMKGISITRWFEKLCQQIYETFQPRTKMKVTRGGARTVNADRRKDMEYNQEQKARQEKIDAILDKISRSGYDGLTAEEKQYLFDASQRHKK